VTKLTKKSGTAIQRKWGGVQQVEWTEHGLEIALTVLGSRKSLDVPQPDKRRFVMGGAITNCIKGAPFTMGDETVSIENRLPASKWAVVVDGKKRKKPGVTRKEKGWGKTPGKMAGEF